MFQSVLERWTRPVVLFFLLAGRWIALRNPDNCTAVDSVLFDLFVSFQLAQDHL